jgi:hypothetical protein
MDQRTDFGDRQPIPGHSAVRIDIPPNLPAKFRRPAQYILTAVRESHGIVHTFCHERCVVIIVPDEATATRVRQFTADLLATMTQPTKTFRLRVEGIAALSRPLVSELLSQLGELIELKMNGTTSDIYADTASILVRQKTDWRCPKSLPFRAYGFDLQAELSVASPSAERPPTPPNREDGEVGWQNAPGRKQRAAKVSPCYDFKRGTCSRGDTCKFRHVAPARTPNVCASPGCSGDCGKRHVSKATPVDCRDFTRGRCSRGQCKFAHTSSVDVPNTAASAPLAAGSSAATSLNRSGPAAAAAASGPTPAAGPRTSLTAASQAVSDLESRGGDPSAAPSHDADDRSPCADFRSGCLAGSRYPLEHSVRRRVGHADRSQDRDLSEEEVNENAQDIAVTDGASADGPMPEQDTSRSPARARRRTRSPCPAEGSPRSVWTKPRAPFPQQPPTHPSKPSSPAAPLVGAGPKAP